MYQDSHKQFLQFMLKNSYLPLDNALQFCKSISDEVTSVSTLKAFISEINSKISKQELRITVLKCEVTGDAKLALLNTANDEVSKLQTNFTPIETEYFQLLLKEIIMAQGHEIQSMACYNLCNNLTGTLRKDGVEKLLEKLVEQGYLVHQDDCMYLGSRCVTEFAPYFQMHCKDYYTSCHLCSEPVFAGKCCGSCHKLMHNHCIDKYLTKHKKCPNCKQIWKEAEEGAEIEENSQQESSEEDEQRPGPSRRRKTRRMVEEDSD